MKKLSLLLMISLLGLSCNQSKKDSSAEYVQIKKDAQLIAEQTQEELMKNVSQAMKKGGSLHAVEFCNEAAIPLTDSMALKNEVKIQRLTEKNRNPDNNLKTSTDKEMYQAFLKNTILKDSLIEEAKSYTYYKRIDIAMPTCLACHGSPQTEIEPATFEKIKKLYPMDKAIDYSKADFRGMWKLDIEK